MSNAGSDGMKVEQLGIATVLQNNQLKMPANQREYSWEDPQILALYQDLAKAKDAGSYFLGTIVGIPSDTGSQIQIIDGQQRLATTAILLSQIQAYLVKQGFSGVGTKAVDRILFTIDLDENEDVPTLVLNTLDNDFFRNRLSPMAKTIKPTRASHELIERAFEIAAEHVRGIVQPYKASEHNEVLNTWIKFLRNDARVLFLTVSSQASAYKMFETLNDRGLKTTQSDLVKNFLYGRSGDRFDEVQQKWERMKGALEGLGSKDLTIDFLRHALTVINGYTREVQIFEVTEAQVQSVQGAVKFVSRMEELAESYTAIHMPEHEKWSAFNPPVRRAVRALNQLSVTPLKPLQMAIADKFNKKHGGLAFDFLVSLSVRLLITKRTRSGAIFETVGKAALDINKGRIYNFGQLKAELTTITPKDTEFEQAFAAYATKNVTLARYLLRSLEMSAKNEPEPWYIPNEDTSAINLEHVLPKKKMENWPKFTDDQHAFYLDKLGNQALVQFTPNSEQQSNSFEDKQSMFADSPYVYTSQIGDVTKWTSKEITDRQKLLATQAKNTWRI